MGDVAKLEQGNLRVELEWIGEGIGGDYDPNDPNDTPLLRFSLWERHGAGWDYVEDTSYCCRVSRDAPMEQIEATLRTLMREFTSAVESGGSVKKVGERLSWIGTTDAPVSPTPSDDDYRMAARNRQEDGVVEFDADAPVSRTDAGAYVQAWVFVSKKEVSGE